MTSTTPAPTAPRSRVVAGLCAAALALSLSPALSPAPAPAAAAAPRSGDASARGGGDGIRERQLDRLLQQVRREGAIGVTAELVTPDGTWRGSAGQAQRGPSRPATDDARFRAASVSKQLVTVLALQQVQEGAWDLDTRLGQVLPRLWPERGRTTLRQLLSHTSGIPDYLLGLAAEADTTPKFIDVIRQQRRDPELVRVARQQRVTAQPGEFSYSNTNFVLVGMMLEKETGRSLPDLVRAGVLQPARMTQSSWPTTREMPRPRLKEYGRLYGRVEDLSAFQPSMFSGAGALLTTARDLNRFQQALGSGELLERRLVTRMRRVTSDGGALGLEYGLGSYRLPDPCRPGRYVHGHDGGSWGTLTLSYASPDGERRVAVSMTGRDYDGDLDSAVALNKVAVLALAQTCGGEPEAPTGAGSTTSRTAAPVG